jgi:hypothetical protein
MVACQGLRENKRVKEVAEILKIIDVFDPEACRLGFKLAIVKRNG